MGIRIKQLAICTPAILMAAVGCNFRQSARNISIDSNLNTADLPFLTGYTVNDFRLERTGGVFHLYILLQKRGEYAKDARFAKPYLPKGSWLNRPGLAWYSGTGMSIMFSNGTKKLETLGNAKLNYPYTGYTMCLVDIQK